MTELFSWTSAQFGLAVGLLVVAVVFLAKLLSIKDRALITRYEKENTEIKVERDFYRDKWLEAIEAAEVGEQATKRLAGGRRRAGGS